ncbi:MAG: hypothetical protein V1646_04305 [bacterium]
MKKLLAFIVSFGLFAFTGLSSMFTKVENYTQGEFLVEKTYEGGKIRTFQRIGKNEWYEADSSGAIEQVSSEQSRRLEASLKAYLLDRAIHPVMQQAPQPLPVEPVVPQAPQLQQQLDQQQVEDDDMGNGILGAEEDGDVQGAGRPEHANRGIIDYAEIGRLALALQHQQPGQPAPAAAGQPEFDWTPYRQALEESSYNKCLVM